MSEDQREQTTGATNPPPWRSAGEVSEDQREQTAAAATPSVATVPAASLVVPVRTSAVLDSAHIGDIEGALGKIIVGDIGARHSLKQRLLTLLAIVGPGLIVMVGDNDAGGVATYSQAGQNYGYSLLWVLLLLIPVLVVNQEMVVRLGAVTGVGHARLINERFGRGWGWFSVGDLFLLNFLTIITEFIGVSLAANYIGLSRYIVVPIAAVALIAIMATGSFRRWERAMFIFIVISVLQIPLLLLSHPRWGPRLTTLWCPTSNGGSVPTLCCCSLRSSGQPSRPGNCSSSSPTSSTSASPPDSSATNASTPSWARSWWSSAPLA